MALVANPLYSNSTGLVGTNYLYPTAGGNLNVTELNPASSTQAATPTASSATSSTSGFLNWLQSNFSDFAGRAGVVVLGFILLTLGFSMLGSQKILQVAKGAK